MKKWILVFAVAILAGCLGTEYKTYADFTHNFSIDYPSNWAQGAYLQGALIGFGHDIASVSVFNLSANELSAAVAEAQGYFRDANWTANYQISGQRNVQFNGLHAVEYYQTYTAAQGQIKQKVIVTPGYMVIAGAPVTDFEKYEGTFDRVLYSFKILSP